LSVAVPTAAVIKVTHQVLQAALVEVAIVQEVSSRLAVPLSVPVNSLLQVSTPTESLLVSVIGEGWGTLFLE
jgi:hypothetical protein